MSKPVRRSGVHLGFSPLSGRVYGFTRWSEKDCGDGTAMVIPAGAKHDVTEAFLFAMNQYRKWQRAEKRRAKKEAADAE